MTQDPHLNRGFKNKGLKPLALFTTHRLALFTTHRIPPRLFRGLLLALCLLLTGVIATAQGDIDPRELADPDGQFIEIDGATLYVIDRGEPDAPAVLLIHGFGGSTFSWRETIDPLVEAGYRVVAFDRPPYGLADKNPELDYSSATYVAQTAGLMDALEIESAALVGHSAGGGVIAAFALAHPERVEALVFVAGAVRVSDDLDLGDGEADEQSGDSAFGALFEIASQIDPESPLARITVRALVTPDLLARTIRANYYDPAFVTPEVIDGYTRQIRVPGWEAAFLKLLSGEVTGGQLDLEAFALVTAPMLMIWGEEDAIVPLAVGEALAAFFPDADFITYPRVGHLPMEESAATFNRDLLDFLEAARSRR